MPRDSRIEKIGKLLDMGSKGESYAEASSRLITAKHIFQEIAAEQLQIPFNLQLQAMKHKTLPEKQELSKWANQQARCFDLAIKAKAGQPCFLIGTAGHIPDVGRFMLVSHGDNRKRTDSSTDLPTYELMPFSDLDHVRQEDWAKRVARKPSTKHRSV